VTGSPWPVLTGLALAADAVAALLLAPLAIACWLRAFRRGDRWSLLAPVLLLAGMALALFDPAAGVGPLVRIGALFPDGLAGAVSPTDDLIAELGVVAGLVALAGFVVLVLRAPLVAGLVMASAVLAMAVHAGGAAGPSAWVALVALLGLPLALGVVAPGEQAGAGARRHGHGGRGPGSGQPALDGGATGSAVPRPCPRRCCARPTPSSAHGCAWTPAAPPCGGC
jgi:hypothetical protein